MLETAEFGRIQIGWRTYMVQTVRSAVSTGRGGGRISELSFERPSATSLVFVKDYSHEKSGEAMDVKRVHL